MEIKGPRTAAAGRLFETLQMTVNMKGKAQCCCCTEIQWAKEMAYVAHYVPYEEVMKQIVPEETLAAYVVCSKCAETIPEKILLQKVERVLIDRGLLQTGHKPLNEPGRHSPKTTRGLGGDRRISLEE